MPIKIIVPVAYKDQSEILVSRLLVSVGDIVESGQALCDLETSKASVSICAPISGTITIILVKTNQSVEPGVELMELEATASSSSNKTTKGPDDAEIAAAQIYKIANRRIFVVSSTDRIAIQMITRAFVGLGFDSFARSDAFTKRTFDNNECIVDRKTAGFAIVALNSTELLPLKEHDVRSVLQRSPIQHAIMEYLMNEFSQSDHWVSMEDIEHGNPNIKRPMGFTATTGDDSKPDSAPQAPPQWLMAELIRSLAQERKQIIDSAVPAKDKLALLEQNRRAITISTGGTVAKTDYIVYAILIFGAVVLIILSLLTAFAGLTPEVTISFLGTVLGGVIATIAQKLGKI